MRFFDLVKEDDAVWAAADGLGQLPARFIADITGRRAKEPADGVLLAVFAHVNADEIVFVVKHELGQGLCQFSLADPA